MAELPKIDSEGLRLAKKLGAERVSSVTSVSKEARCPIQDPWSCLGYRCQTTGVCDHNRRLNLAARR
jgi:hypothetical protein